MSFLFKALFSKKHNEFKKMKSTLAHHAPLHSCDIKGGFVQGMISVVLPVYNCEKYLEESILSVLNQTYTNIELIIVDDGSDDSSGQIADSFIAKDSRVSVIHQKNLKLPAALNNGFSAAKGEFLTWTSADNRMLPCCLEILSAELMRNREYDMVFGNMRLINENGDIIKPHGWYESPVLSGNVILPDSTEKLNTIANNTIGAAFLYRASSAAVLNCYSNYKYTLEDYDYFMRMNSLLTIKHIIYKKPIYEYRMHSESLTSHDGELGITASRDSLMQLDALRRRFYTKRLAFYADGADKGIISALSAFGYRVYDIKTADKYAGASPMQIFYINFGNCPPSWSIPKGVPRFLVCDEPTNAAFDYDVTLCKNSLNLKNADGWLCSHNSQSLASFILLRAKNDIMYKYEETEQ